MDFKILHISESKKEPSYQVLQPGKEEFWAKHIAELARKGAALGDCGKMCSDCAFKHPQPMTTDYIEAVDGAMKIILMGGVFNCHTDDHEDAGRPCVGMQYTKQFMDTLD